MSGKFFKLNAKRTNVRKAIDKHMFGYYHNTHIDVIQIRGAL